jgi:hypothetical protein
MHIVLIIFGIILLVLFVIYVLPILLSVLVFVLKILFWGALIGGVCFLTYKIIRYFHYKKKQQNEINIAVQSSVGTWLQGDFCFPDIEFVDPYDEDDDDLDDE